MWNKKGVAPFYSQMGNARRRRLSQTPEKLTWNNESFGSRKCVQQYVELNFPQSPSLDMLAEGYSCFIDDGT